MEIDIRIIGLVIAQIGRPYFEHARSHLASILQMMAIGVAGAKGSAVSGAQNLFAPVRHQHDLAFKHAHELFRPGVPVPLAGPGGGLQFEQVDADLLQPARNREPTTKLVRALRCKQRGIARTCCALSMSIFFT